MVDPEPSYSKFLNFVFLRAKGHGFTNLLFLPLYLDNSSSYREITARQEVGMHFYCIGCTFVSSLVR